MASFLICFILDNFNMNSSPPSSSQSTSSNRSPFTPGTSFSPELKREDDKFKVASAVSGRAIGNMFHGENAPEQATAANRISSDDPFVGTAFGAGVNLALAQAMNENARATNENARAMNDNVGPEQPQTGNDDADLGEDPLTARLADLNIHGQPNQPTPGLGLLRQPVQNESAPITRYPPHGKFTHEIQTGEPGWVSRVLELTFHGDWTFKACTDNLRALVLELEKCSYVRQGRRGQNQVYVVFDDLRVAKAALKSLHDVPLPLRSAYDVGFVTYPVYNSECRTSMTPFHGFETQVSAEVVLHLPSMVSMADLTDALDLTRDKLSELMFDCGDWRTVELTRKSTLSWSLTAEFYSAEAAARFLYNHRATKHKETDRIVLSTKGKSFIEICTKQTPQAVRALQALESERARLARYPKFTSRDRVSAIARVDDSGNQIDPFLIEHGSDVRVTVMLRNIPNRMNCTELKAFIDRYCRYNYDFLYLRIDFENDCNVGYAFINFTAPEHVREFYRNVHGYTWEMAGSSKTASLCYATTQGKEALVERFRNSCVSQKLPWMRPHLYISSADWPEHENSFPLKRLGDELPFPLPNNLNKLHRSMAVADEQGLFHNKDKRSGADLRGYDRGNPNNINQHMNVPQSSGAIGTRLGGSFLSGRFTGPIIGGGGSSFDPTFRPISMPYSSYGLAARHGFQNPLLPNFAPYQGQLSNVPTLTSAAGPSSTATNGIGTDRFSIIPNSLRATAPPLPHMRSNHLANQYTDAFAAGAGHITRPAGTQSRVTQAQAPPAQEDDPTAHTFNPHEPGYNNRYRY